MKTKTDSRYYSFSEASSMTQIKPHVLRYWETQFSMLRPRKNKAGNRQYRKRDLKLILLIRELLYDQGFTISGARKKLQDEKEALRDQMEFSFGEVDRAALLLEVKHELERLHKDLKTPVSGG